MSPADLTKPFSESCCDGGECSSEMSAQPCGCDKGANWLCQRHRMEKEYEERKANADLYRRPVD